MKEEVQDTESNNGIDDNGPLSIDMRYLHIINKYIYFPILTTYLF